MGEFMIKLEEDKLNRKDLLDNIFSIFSTFGNQDGQGLTMLINGKYGTGKSTLLNFIKEKNLSEDNKFNIVSYDAWECNYFENPIIPLMYSLSKLENNAKKVKDAAKNVVKAIPISFFRTLANITKIDISAIADKESDEFSDFDKYKNAIDSYKEVLKGYCKDKKTIFLVDELDRCLPEYQIKVLESIYHVLNIPNLIVVIAIDKDQLDASIKSKFGIHTDTYGYLSKFIQYELDLPKGNTYEYIQSLMTFHVEDSSYVKSIMANMFESINLPIRDCQIIVQKLNLICKEVKDGWGHTTPYYYYYPTSVLFLLLLKHTNQKVYKKYFNNTIEMSYDKTKIALKNTTFYKFLNDIENSDFKQLFDYLLKDGFGQAVALQLINLFDDIALINEQELATYLNRTVEDVVQLTRKSRFGSWYYPGNRNSLIKTVDIIL